MLAMYIGERRWVIYENILKNISNILKNLDYYRESASTNCLLKLSSISLSSILSNKRNSIFPPVLSSYIVILLELFSQSSKHILYILHQASSIKNRLISE